MALDLFKRVETRKGLFAVEKITLIYNLLTSILILFLFQRMDHPWHMLLDRAMIAAMTFLLMYLFRRLYASSFRCACFLTGIRILSSSTGSFRIWIMFSLSPNSLFLMGNLLSGSVIRSRIFWSVRRSIWDISSIIR